MSDFPRNTTNAPLTPANTNEAVIYSGTGRGALGIAVIVANVSGGSANATVRWFDGTSNWAIRNATAIATGGSLDVDLHNLKIPGGTTPGSLKVTSSVASALTFTAIVEELTR